MVPIRPAQRVQSQTKHHLLYIIKKQYKYMNPLKLVTLTETHETILCWLFKNN